MKLNLGEDSSNQDLDSSVSRNRISLPQGLFGFSQIRFMDLMMFDKEELHLCGYGKKRKTDWLL